MRFRAYACPNCWRAFQGSSTTTAANGTRPAGTYVFDDEHLIGALFRAQRNFKSATDSRAREEPRRIATRSPAGVSIRDSCAPPCVGNWVVTSAAAQVSKGVPRPPEDNHPVADMPMSILLSSNAGLHIHVGVHQAKPPVGGTTGGRWRFGELLACDLDFIGPNEDFKENYISLLFHYASRLRGRLALSDL